MRTVILLLLGVLLIGCKKKSNPKPPEATNLVFPDKDSECTTGRNLNQGTSEIEFKWMVSDHTESYELRVTNLNSNITQTINTAALSAKLPIARGEPFSWLVRSKNTKVTETAVSETWRFYNAGFQSTYAPFPAEPIQPKNGTSVFKDINNEVTLEWYGADIENDINEYELYFSTTTPPETLLTSLSSGVTFQKVSVVPNTSYYWRVVTKDEEGNSSDSGIFVFKAL
ncbi:hypothetical protein [Maribacter sp. HTCC2170]|uniref:hypothetical protein n=1 Tax=Maribacter sp. (strain HTCC2170 / KCCM 42371) TaxID=313603 RepID=UPI00006BD461|nr:hypothetical protein [Maribacter sp. HTCC2170]EAR02452.1 hypothetical protein FB2170_04175 [Maribacter sp. HTCC2170]